MTEKVLTNDEQDALLEGVSSGAIEVQSADGPTYATVKPFEINPRSHIVSNSYPRLQLLNQLFAQNMSSHSELLLQTEVAILCTDTGLRFYNDFREQFSGPSISVVFNATPLEGSGLVVFEQAMVGLLVESFFGGSGNERSEVETEGFTPGELAVSRLYADVVLRTIRETWQSDFEIQPELDKVEVKINLLDIAEESGLVVASEFEVSFPEHQGVFRILLPLEMIKPMVPIFEGQKLERDEALDAHWESVIRARLADTVIHLTSDVGHAKLTVGDLINLEPGDVIPIDSPTAATILAHQVPILHGRFGVHAGHNAIETTGWIDSETAN